MPNSAAFRPSLVGDIADDDEHYIVFEPGKGVGFFCSDNARLIERQSLAEGIRAGIDIGKIDMHEGLLDELKWDMLKMVKDTIGDVGGLEERFRESRDSAGLIRYLAHTYFDSEVLFLR